MIGDSVCTDVYVSSLLSTFWRERTGAAGESFAATKPASSGKFCVPDAAADYACAYAASPGCGRGLRSRQFRGVLQSTRNRRAPASAGPGLLSASGNYLQIFHILSADLPVQSHP